MADEDRDIYLNYLILELYDYLYEFIFWHLMAAVLYFFVFGKSSATAVNLCNSPLCTW